jgi:hypothetical protein
MHPVQIKARIVDYLHHLTTYDYIAYGWLLGILIGFLLLAVVLAGTKPKTSLFMIFMVLTIMIVGPMGMKYGLDQTVRKVLLVDKNSTELPFAKNLVVFGKIKNFGRVDMAGCRVFVDVLRKEDNKYKELLYRLKPIRKQVLKIDKKLPKGEEMPYKIVFDHFKLEKGYYVSQSVECF